MAIHKKISIRLFFTVLTVAVVALFVASFAAPASAQVFTTTGKIVSIDKDGKTFTIDPHYYGGAKSSAADLRTFALSRGGTLGEMKASIWMGNEKRSFDDLRVGDLVTVDFHQEANGLVLADGITIHAPAGVAVRPEERVIPGVTEKAAPAFSLTGKVVSLDPDARSIAVNPVYPGMTYSGTREVRTFALDNTSLYRNGQPVTLTDINVGDLVTVNYHQESNGRIIADSIAINPPMGRYPEQGSVGFSLSGRIASIDKNARTFVVEPSAYTAERAGGRTFFLEDGSIMLGSKTVTLSDLKVGDMVTVNYHQASDGRIIADSIAVSAPKYPEQGMLESSFSGKIVSLDKNTGTFVVEPLASLNFESGRAFYLGNNPAIMMGDRAVTLNDLNIGDQVTITYHQDNSGNIVADSVAITSPETAPFPEERG